VHDLGHWGTNYLDNLEEKKGHWRLGALLALKVCGARGWGMCAGHCNYSGYPQSKLYKADKYSWYLAPVWWLVCNDVVEPKLIRPGCNRRESAVLFKARVRESIESGAFRGTHDIYLEQTLKS
jgi:hypothetical protein